MDDTNTPNPNEEFKYVFGEKEELVIILFYGNLDAKAIPTLEKCGLELKEKTQPVVLLSFRELLSLKPPAHPDFAKFQKNIRDSNKRIGVCGFRPDVKELLVLKGIVRGGEIFNNVSEAWQALSQNKNSKIKNI